MADSLAPLINKRIAKLKLQLQKELAQSQRVLNNAFLRYRKCKSIKKSQENLQRVLNTIEKDKKKGVAWSDPDFGPS
jgi:predicted Rossmann fold nucleotide-binding protein DprA/Smf involved in DNA uptake